MAGKKNEVEIDVGMDVESKAIARAFDQIDARIKMIQGEMAKVSATSLAAAKSFKTEVMGAMRDFNKASGVLEKFEKNINGPQKAKLAQWDKEELAANRLAETKRKLRKQARDQDDKDARKKLADIEAQERRENQLAEQRRKFRAAEAKKEERAKTEKVKAIDAEEQAFNRLQESKRKLRERDRKKADADAAAEKKAIEQQENAANRLFESKRKLREQDRKRVAGDARSDASPDRTLANRALAFELNSTRDLLAVGARRAATQARINELMLKRQLLHGQERKDVNAEINNEIKRLRLIDQRIEKIRRANDAEARGASRPVREPARGGGGVFGSAGLTGVFLRTAGYGAAAAAIYGTVAALRDGVTFSLQFEDAMARLGAISGATSTQMDRLGKSIKDVAANSRFSTLELAEAATVLAQAGFTQKEIEESLASVSQLATASGVTIAEATDVATAAIGSFQLQAAETGHINDVLASALNRTKLNIQQVALGIQYAGATAHENKISFEELTAVMAVMANAGIRSGSTIGTGIRQFLVDLQTPTEKMTTKMKELGLTMADIDVDTLGLPEVLNRLAAAGFDSAAAYGTLETRAAAAYLVLRNNRQAIYEQIQAQNQVGQSTEAAAKGQKSLTAEWQRFKNQLNSAVEEGLKPATEGIREMLKAANDAGADKNLQELYKARGAAKSAEELKRLNREINEYREVKDRVAASEEQHADAIEKANTAVNEATEKVGQQKTKLASLDDAIARVYVRQGELKKNSFALAAETSTLMTRFQGLASHLNTTKNGYIDLTTALREYRLEQMRQLGEGLLSQKIEERNQATTYNRAATTGLQTMKQTGIYAALPKEVQNAVEAVRRNPGDNTLRQRLSDLTQTLTGNQRESVSGWLVNIDKAVTSARSARRTEEMSDTVQQLLGPTGRRLQTEVSALPGQSNDKIQAKIAQLQKDRDTKARNDAARRAYDMLIEQAQSYLGSGSVPEPTKSSSSTKSEGKPEIQFGSPVQGTPVVTSGFGPRARPTGANGQRGSSNHQGVDIRGKVGDPVLAAADGWVKTVDFQKTGYGKYIILNHGAGTETLYAHLSEVLVEEGIEVKRGEIIGKVGQTGTATAPHLHYQRKTSKGVDRNPLKGNAPGDMAEIATGSAAALEKLAEEEERRAERNELAGARMKVRNTGNALGKSLELLKDNIGALTEAELREMVEADFKAWEKALIDQQIALDEKNNATDEEAAEHLAELRETIRQKRVEVEEAFFESFMKGIMAGLERLEQQWEADAAARQHEVDLQRARLNGLQSPENRGRVPDYVAGFQQRRIERAEKDQRSATLAALPEQIAAADAARIGIFMRTKLDTSLSPTQLKAAEDQMKALELQAAALRREFELLNAEEEAVNSAPKGFGENAQVWLEDYRARNGLDGPNGFQWGDLFEGMTGAMDAAQQSLGGFFSNVINKTKTVGEAFKQMKDEVLMQIGDMIAKLIAKKAMQWLTSLATTIIGAPPAGKFHGGQIKAFTGRYITDGFPNRDSVNARIAKGEYVVRKSAVDSVGVDFMNRLNERGSHALRSMAPKPVIVPRAEQKMNVYVVAPEQRPSMGPNDVLVTIANDIAAGGQTKQLIKHIAQGG